MKGCTDLLGGGGVYGAPGENLGFRGLIEPGLLIGKTSPLFAKRADKGRGVKSGSGSVLSARCSVVGVETWGDRPFKLGSGTTSEYGRYVRSLRSEEHTSELQSQ